MNSYEFYNQLQNNYDMAIPESEMITYRDMLAEENGHESYSTQMAKKRISYALDYVRRNIESAQKWTELGNHEMAKTLLTTAAEMTVQINQAVGEL